MMWTRQGKRKLKKIAFFTLLLFVFQTAPPIQLWMPKASAELYMHIFGKVTDAQTGQPIQNLDIFAVRKNDPKSANGGGKTRTDGTYDICCVPPGTYQLFIDPQSPYIREQLPHEVTVIRGKNIINANLNLQKGSFVEGKVLAADGVTPVAGAGLVLSSNNNVLVVARTDAIGNFKAQGLTPNQKFQVFVLKEGEAGVLFEITTPASEQTLQNVNVVLGSPSTALRGTATSNGNSVPDAIVRVKGNESMGYAKTDSQGDFQIMGLKEGTYTVVVEKEGYDIAADFDVQVVNGQQTTKDFSLVATGTQSGNRQPGLKTRNMAMQKLFGNDVAVASIGPIIFAQMGGEGVLVWEGASWQLPFVVAWLIANGYLILSIALLSLLIGCLIHEMVRVEYKRWEGIYCFWNGLRIVDPSNIQYATCWYDCEDGTTRTMTVPSSVGCPRAGFF